MTACAHCGTPCPATYTSGRYQHLTRPRRYCSPPCATAAWRGRHPGYDAAYRRARRRGAVRPHARTPALEARTVPIAEPWPCRTCGVLTPPGGNRAHGRCHACITYLRRHGTERPPRLYAPQGPARCAACGRLLTPAHQGGHGLCHRCLLMVYRWRRGITKRPRKPFLLAAIRAHLAARAAP